MGTVAIAAVGGETEDFREIVSDLLFFHVESAESLDARGIDEVSVFSDGKHLGERGGMHAFVVIGGDLTGLYLLLWQDGVDER